MENITPADETKHTEPAPRGTDKGDEVGFEEETKAEHTHVTDEGDEDMKILLELELAELQESQSWAVINEQHTVGIQQLGRERDEMEARYVKTATDNVRLQVKIDELIASAILADLRARIREEQSRIKAEKAEYDLHCLYRGILFTNEHSGS